MVNYNWRFMTGNFSMSNDKKITLLTCHFNQLQQQHLRKVFADHNINCNIQNCNPDQEQWLPAFLHPDFIITEPILWELGNKESLLPKLNSAGIPIIIWSENISAKIMATVFDQSSISFISRTEDESPLIQFLLRNKALND